MNQQDVKTAFNNFIKNGKYELALNLIIEYFENIDDEIVENTFRYWKLLYNEPKSSKYRSKFVEPLSKYLALRNKEFTDFINVAKEINKLESIALNEFNKEIGLYFQFPYVIAMPIILSKFEIYYHMLSKRVRQSISDNIKENMDLNETATAIIQMSTDSMSYLLHYLQSNESKFRMPNSMSKDSYITLIKKIEKKTSNPERLVRKINALLYIESLKFSNIQYDLKVLVKDNTVHFIYKDYSDYRKKRIAQLRLENFEENVNRDFEYKSTDIEIESDISKLVTVNQATKSFIFEFKIISPEFLEILQGTYKKFEFSSNQIYLNNFLNSDEMKRRIKFNSVESNVNFEDAINFYFALESLACFYYKGIEYYYDKTKDYPTTSILVIGKDNLYEIISQFFSLVVKSKISKSDFAMLLKLYEFGENGIYDFYYKPIIDRNETIIIVPSVFRHNMFHRTFLNHMNKVDSSYKTGNILELYVKKVVKKHGFKIYERKSPNLNFNLNGKKKGDIDILMLMDDYIFYGQIKNRMTPLDLDDYDSYNRMIRKKAINQLKHAEEFLNTNPKYIIEELGIIDTNDYKLVPFILTNSFYGSGEIINGIPIIDISSFNKFFKMDDIKIYEGDKTTVVKKIHDDKNSLAENFVEFLFNPYFLDDKLYNNLYYGSYMNIKKHKVIVSCDLALQDEKIRESYVETYLENADN